MSYSSCFFGTVLFTCCLIMAGPAQAAIPFLTEVVDPSPWSGRGSSMALDLEGRPHITYADQTNNALKYAVKGDDGWVIETIETWTPVSIVFYRTSLALDPSGVPHVSYHGIGGADLKYAVRTESGWSVETVASLGDVGLHSSLVVDGTGRPHIAYWDETNGDLKYAVKNGGSWTIETVTDLTSNDMGRHVWLVLDDLGDPHVSFQDETNFDLMYGVRREGSWTLTSVDTTGSVGRFTSLALDNNGRPHIAYENETIGQIKHASLDSGTWSVEVVDTAVYWFSGYPVAMNIDSDGDLLIAYGAGLGSNHLKLAVKTGSTWSIETVDGIGAHCSYPTVALDRHDNPVIAYHDLTSYSLLLSDSAVHLVRPRGGERWTVGSRPIISWQGRGAVDVLLSLDGGLTYETLVSFVSRHEIPITVPAETTLEARVQIVRWFPYSVSECSGFLTIELGKDLPWWLASPDENGDVGEYSSLDLDANGTPHIAYHAGSTRQDLMYAVRNGSNWVTETVDSLGIAGWYASLELDQGGDPHIAYQGETNLKYAFKSGGAWNLETVDGMADVGLFASLELSAEGLPRIAYYHAVGELWYAERDAGAAWMLEPVDQSGDAGEDASLALDASGIPHIAYRDGNSNLLKYAVKTGTSWQLEVVENGFVGFYASLEVDEEGVPVIAYYDFTNGVLKMATREEGSWRVEIVDAEGSVGEYASLVLDAAGEPHISYFDATGSRLKYAYRAGEIWEYDVPEVGSNTVGGYTSLTLDDEGIPRISYYDLTDNRLRYASAAVEVASPTGGSTWPVGAERAVTWDGMGTVDVYLSVDGGVHYHLLATEAGGGEHRLLVPHTPSRFCRVKLERSVDSNRTPTSYYPRSVALSDSLFTIEASVTLLGLQAVPASGGDGVLVTWNTDPGPSDLAGYRLEKSTALGVWRPLATVHHESSFLDPAGKPGDRYRLYAVNGLGEDLFLGETEMPSPRRLSASPLPYRGGELVVWFNSASGLGGGKGPVHVALYDINGRRVRTLAEGLYPAGRHEVTWNGRDEQGVLVSAGVYFLRAWSGGQERAMKVVVMP